MNSSTSRGPYETPYDTCPYCGNDQCQADFCDVGVGLVQCGPYYCEGCYASEIGAYDKERVLTEEERKTGWYAPNTPVSETANTIGGVLVDHKLALDLYRKGLLDE